MRRPAAIAIARLLVLAASLFFCAACEHRTFLVATPTISRGEAGLKVFDSVPDGLRTPEMEILYAADRAVVKKTLLGVQYGSGRTGKLAIGTATVAFNPAMSWDELVRVSTTEKRTRPRVFMELKSAVEYGLLAVPLSDMIVSDGRYVLPDSAADALKRGREQLHEVLRDRLAHSQRKDVYIFVHGFNNTFEDAVFRLGMLWHLAGRPGVPIAYTWPAGRGGLTGYAYDRESGEFTVSHLKHFIRAVATCPDVQRIHLVAHSRGTDVVCTALRELNIEERAKNLRTKEQLKLENLVLAAPDMDDEVFEQRFAIEDLHLAANRTTIYFSETDFAPALSRWLFGGGNRMGNLTPEKFTPDARKKLAQLKSFYLIDCNVSGFSSSHDYAFAHPAVVSDLILLLRDGKAPGPPDGRPLHTPYEGVWEINNDYPAETNATAIDSTATAPASTP